MYTFKPATERIKYMRELIRNRTTHIDSEIAMIVTDVHKQHGNVPPIIRRPLYAKAIAERKTIRIEDFELIVGNKGKAFLGSSMSPEWMGAQFLPMIVERNGWTIREDGMYHNPDDEDQKACMAVEDYENFCSIRNYWDGKTVAAVGDAFRPDCLDELASLGVDDYGGPQAAVMMIPAGHLTPGFQKIINVGYGAIKKQATDWMEEHRGNLMGGDMDKYMFYKAAEITCDAAITLVKRYAEACAKKAEECVEPKRKAELEKMADGLAWISVNPARTFWEACQAAMLYQLFLSFEGGYPASAFGRFDQYTWPFLKSDLEKGTLTLDEAQEICDAFFLKANCFYGGWGGKGVNTQGIGNTYQHTTIGGVIPETGEDATNPITFMVLETVGRLLLHDPTISLRINKNTPVELWDCAIETSKLVGGLPLFQNDEVIIPGLMKELDFELEDARDYSLIGCQEIVGSGNDYPAGNGLNAPHASVHYGVVLGMAINNGINPFNGKQARLHTGYLYEMNSMDEVRKAFEDMARYVLKMHVTIHNYTEFLTVYNSPHPGLSIGIVGCMEKGMDCTVGGAKYNSYGGTATGLATVADSLTTIKYMCFDKKICTTRELYDAVMANWEGYETLRQYILANVPHYGNNDPYADEELAFVVDTYYKICSECYSNRSKVYKAGMYGAADHIVQGYTTWATPDGRKTGEPIADAMSPAQGRDKNGPTAVFGSTICFDHTRFMDGMAVNLKIHPSAVNSEETKAALRDMTKTFFEDGGMEVQYNIVSGDTMRAAQQDPESHRDLVVRVAGYSAYFIELAAELQNDLIARTENMLG
ncbi:MAG: hypothetical protein GX111_01300 [Clostridiales bacterium]|nr:hypothetical protein [Clostridiales bacterium]